MSDIHKRQLPSPEEQVEMKKEYLKFNQWPKWPPKTTPADRMWWLDDTVILPGRESILIPNLAIFEINGLPTAGKSTMEQQLGKAVREKLPGKKMDHVNVETISDPLITTPQLVQDNSLISLMDDDSIPPLMEKADWMTSLFLQVSKSVYWAQRLSNPQNYSESSVPTILIANRGPTDALIWQYTLLTHHGDPNFEIPPAFDNFIDKNCLETTARLQSISNLTNAKIFVGIGQDKAQQRRAIAGKEHKGWVTDSPIFKDFSAWIAYWIDNVYPRVKMMKNSGLLLVDGDAEIDSNVQKISDYIVNSAWRLLPGCY